MRVKAWIGLVVLAVVCAAPGSAQTPLGDELSMSVDNDLRLRTPVVGFFDSGDLVAVWERSWTGLAARTYDAQGQPHGGDLLLAANDPIGDVPFRGVISEHSQPELVVLGDQSFLLFWTRETNEISVDVFYTNRNLISREVLVQRFEQGGTPVGQPVQVSESPGFDGRPAAALLADGSVVVAWEQRVGGSANVLGRRVDTAGRLQGPVFAIGEGLRADVAANPDGGFAVVWDEILERGQQGRILGRQFDPAGDPVAAAVELSSTVRTQGSARVAVDPAGRTVAVWQGSVPSPDDAPDAIHLFSRRLGSNGQPLGAESQVTADLEGDDHSGPILTRAAGSGLFLAWMVWKGDFRVYVAGGRLNAAGRVATPVRISENPLGLQFQLGAATDGDGRHLVAWLGYDDSDELGVRGRLVGAVPGPAQGVCAAVRNGLPFDLLVSRSLCSD